MSDLGGLEMYGESSLRKLGPEGECAYYLSSDSEGEQEKDSFEFCEYSSEELDPALEREESILLGYPMMKRFGQLVRMFSRCS